MRMLTCLKIMVGFILLLTLNGCGGHGDIGMVDDGVEASLSVAAHPDNALMAIAHVDAESGASVVIEFTSDTTDTHQTTKSDVGTEHDITLIGMRSQTTYTMTAIATFDDGSTCRSESVEFTTGALPDTPPAVSVTTSTGQSAGGITFFGSGMGESDSSRYWGVDEEGEIVWYLHGDYTIASSPALREVEPGVLLIFLQNSIRTITTAGETLEEYTLGRYHHDARLLPNGNVLMLSTETMVDEEGTSIAGDKIIEKNAAGETLWQWSSFDHLDTTRFPGVLSTRQSNNGAVDWSHSNALVYIEEEDAILLSVRSQSWVVKIDHSTGNVLWIMGPDTGTHVDYQYNDNFFMLTSGSWMANQHAPLITQDGEVLIYDNRNESGGSTSMSRAVKFAFDESSMTAEQTWEAIAPKYTSSLGDVDELSNGNVMMCAGGPGSNALAYIVEVSPGASAETVWSMSVDTNVYRAERMSWDSFLQKQ